MNFFNYESKPMQILMILGDLIIANLLFILCCLPIFTIGAAQAGLYTAVKSILDPEDDTYCTSAFFKGFKTGFKQITGAWCLMAIPVALLYVVMELCSQYAMTGYGTLPLWASIIALCVVALSQSLLPIFHCRFNCTAMQLIRNTWFLACAHPLRSIFVGVTTWLPLIVLGFNFTLFSASTPVLFLIYYSGAFLFNFSFMKKPFNVLIEHYNQTHNSESTPQEEPAMIEAGNSGEDE